ncbi:MAG TPA: glycosyltransferase [Candidatus Paceibacterota bacterium]|nr:glycosyltransferase [Candidatus Paceibacterota bacterium]
MRKKILYVITKSNWGGAQRYVFDLATSLPKEEFEVSVAFGQKGRLAEALQKAGIPTHEIKSLQRDISFGADTGSIAELITLFQKERPDIVHLNSSKAGVVGALAARLAGVPNIIFTVHGWPFGEQRNMLWRVFAWGGSWATTLLAHKVICICNYDASMARKTLPFSSGKIVRIYNGIDAGMQFGTGEKIRSAFPAGATITGTIGELNRNKNQQALIEQAKQSPNMFVAIVGEGEARPELEKQIRDYNLQNRVKLFGFMPASEALKGFDIFALPSIKEGLPYVLLEAKLAELPIVANRVGGIGEILDSQNLEQFSLRHMLKETEALYRTAS